MVNILIAYLNEYAPVGCSSSREKETVPQIGQVGVKTEFPGVPVGLNHFWLAGHVLVIAV